MGDSVIDAEYDEEGKVKSVGTANFGDIRMYADNFVLATGSFFSKGLVATPEKVTEPVFGVDLIINEGRDNWFDRNFWKKQNYISFGAAVNGNLNVSVEGKTVTNLYAAGSIIGGYNALYEGSGGGVAIVTAMKTADMILEK